MARRVLKGQGIFHAQRLLEDKACGEKKRSTETRSAIKKVGSLLGGRIFFT